MKIGKLELELIKPEKVEEQLRALLGLGVAEVHAMLARAAIADHIGAALVPFLKEAPARVELAVAIVEHGIVEARAKVRGLYAELLGVKAAPGKVKPNGKA